MITHYLTIAFRNIFRNKVFSSITVFGLALGMATSILILLWVIDEIEYDRFHEHIDRLYCIVERQDYSDGQKLHTNNTPFALKDELISNYPEVQNAARTLWMGDRPMSYEDNVVSIGPVAFVDPEFLQILTFKLLKGDPNALKEPNTIMITEKVAVTFFGDGDAIGKTLQMDGKFDFTVGAVLENVPENSTFQFNILIPFVQMKTIFERDLLSWNNNWPRTTVLLKDEADAGAFEKKIENLCKDHGQENTTLFIKPLSRDHLYSNSGESNNIQYVYLFIAIGLIILIIACVNFVNLATAKSEDRAMEVGIRKVAGASRSSLIMQFLIEKLLLVFISLLISIILTVFLTPLFNDISGKTLQLGLFKNPNAMLLFIGVGLFAGLLSSVYPSFALSSFSPVRALKSMMTSKSKRGFSLRSALVILQFSLSIILIVSAIVVLSQLLYIRSFNLGYNVENLVFINLPGQSRQLHEPFSNELRKIPGVVSLTKADKPPFWGGNSSWNYEWEGKDPELKVLICMMWVDKNYFDVLGIPLDSGNTFSDRFENYNFDSVENVDVILNAEAIRRMKMNEPVGKFFGRTDKKGTIIGVAHDFHFESLHNTVEPLVLLPLQDKPNVIIARIQNEQIHETIAQIEKLSFGFFDDRLQEIYQPEVRISKLFRYFTAIAIFISCLGLLGLASFSIEQQTKAIGIRKALGASVNNIVFLLTRDFAKWVIVSFVIACPVAWYAMHQWLQNFAYKTDLTWWMFVVAGILALAVALLTVSFQTLKAAMKNPVDSLRYE